LKGYLDSLYGTISVLYVPVLHTTYHLVQTVLDESETSWVKLVDGEVPCLVVVELALAFRYYSRGFVEFGNRSPTTTRRRRLNGPSVAQGRTFEQVQEHAIDIIHSRISILRQLLRWILNAFGSLLNVF
jgi:hypothetical protein